MNKKVKDKIKEWFNMKYTYDAVLEEYPNRYTILKVLTIISGIIFFGMIIVITKGGIASDLTLLLLIISIIWFLGYVFFGSLTDRTIKK